jgi:hypothetical protein
VMCGAHLFGLLNVLQAALEPCGDGSPQVFSV